MVAATATAVAIDSYLKSAYDTYTNAHAHTNSDCDPNAHAPALIDADSDTHTDSTYAASI